MCDIILGRRNKPAKDDEEHTMIMTTPNEFLQFAEEMGLERIKPPSIANNDHYTTTGLSVLNNLCRLIEQIHQLKTENQHLRAHLELVNHVDKFQQRFSGKEMQENKHEKQKQLISAISIQDEEKSDTLSPTNSLKIQRSLSNREHKEDSSSILPIDPELIESNLSRLQANLDLNKRSFSEGTSSVPTWNKVRHALKFTLRRKPGTSTSPPLSHVDRQIPTISVSIESDEDQFQDNKSFKKKKKNLTTNENRPTILAEDTDQDDESTQFVKAYHKTRLDGNETLNSSSTDRPEMSPSTNLPFNTSNPDDEHLLTRKQSKIARYRRKLRSKLDTVKRQFSDQNSSAPVRLFHNLYGSTFDDIGSGINHASLTAQLAPALTKSYQQKMREWQTMQKSHFLVNYRRQSITPKTDLNSNSRKSSASQTPNEISTNPAIASSPIDNFPSTMDDFNHELETHLTTFGPVLSPNQRSLIVHQWREIMSEEISLRRYNEYLQNKMIRLKDLESNLKSLKSNIFCTKHFLKQQSMINIHQNEQSKPSSIPQRCRSLDSFISMPASWILAVQSAAYSDILDGTSTKTTERAIIFNQDFFDRLEHFKHDRLQFEEDSIKDLRLLNRSKIKPKRMPKEKYLRVQRVPTRGCLRKLSLISSSEFPQHFLADPIVPLQTIISYVQPLSNNELLLSSNNGHKQAKRSRFDLKKTFQRSRSMYMTQFHSWLQRRRQHHSSVERRKSATESKASTPCSTPTLLGSPRLARLHQKLFRTSRSSSSQSNHTPVPVQLLDDSDYRSPYEPPVRIYFPPLTPPTIRPVRLTDTNLITTNNNTNNHIQDLPIEPLSNLTTPISDRKYTSSTSSSSSLKITTAKERRESFATSPNVFTHRCL